jgi:hypothetical protein
MKAPGIDINSEIQDLARALGSDENESLGLLMAGVEREWQEMEREYGPDRAMELWLEGFTVLLADYEGQGGRSAHFKAWN